MKARLQKKKDMCIDTGKDVVLSTMEISIALQFYIKYLNVGFDQNLVNLPGSGSKTHVLLR